MSKKFQCYDKCGLCCENPAIIVSPSLGDLYRIGQKHNKTVLDVADESTTVWFTDSSYRRVGMVFEMPCHYLDDKICSVHESKPVICRMSPEDFIAGKADDPAAYQYFPCITEATSITQEQKRILRSLKKLMDKEKHITDRYIYNPALTVNPNRKEYLKTNRMFRTAIEGKEDDLLFVIKCEQDALKKDFLDTLIQRLEKAVKKSRVMDALRSNSDIYFSLLAKT